ncbi:MAG: hypothetical protein QOE92_1319 [Chloroflexota bacterium]|nr:hypothetical protein [Chloroflexota bacterium]
MADIRVLVADDDQVVTDALADLIEACDGMTVVAVAADADSAMTAAARSRPDVALVDVRMPGGGPKAIRGILKEWPGTRVLALSASQSRDTVLEMLHAGAAGYLVKGVLPAEVIDGIRRVSRGQTPLSAEVAGGVIDKVRAHLQADELVDQGRRRMVDQVSDAIDGDALRMVFQPIFDLDTRGLVGVESLARFTPEPIRAPNKWFEMAAQVGMGTKLEAAAVSRAIALRSGLPAGAFMTVNLSPEAVLLGEVNSLIPTDFADRLVIELTEHAPVPDYQALNDAFSPLRAAGATLAIDDAGAGFASLRHILELAPQYIKLDISITNKIEHDRAAMALAIALTSFAGAIGAKIIAEGIETEAQAAALRALGCEYGQGYYFGRPMPAAEIEALIVAATAVGAH